MPEKWQVESALSLARRLVDERLEASSPVSVLVGLVRRFSVFEFDTPDLPDADGYLFQYGKVSWFSEPTFVLSIVRQLEVVDSFGGQAYYLQVHFEFRYPLDDRLGSVGSHSEWWFPADSVSLDEWLDSVNGSPIGDTLARKTPREFEVWQDQT